MAFKERVLNDPRDPKTKDGNTDVVTGGVASSGSRCPGEDVPVILLLQRCVVVGLAWTC